MRVQREKIRSGQKRNKGFEGEGEWKCRISRVGARLNSSSIQAGGVEEEVTVLVDVGSPEEAGTQQGDSSRSESFQEF